MMLPLRNIFVTNLQVCQGKTETLAFRPGSFIRYKIKYHFERTQIQSTLNSSDLQNNKYLPLFGRSWRKQPE